jgi:Kef-type K+ transport system membrane component KefB
LFDKIYFKTNFSIMNNIFAVFYLGALLLASLAIGRLASLLKIPKVTGYIFAGILLSPSAANIFSHTLSQLVHDAMQGLSIISDLALGLIAFSIGGEFEHERFKKIGKTIITMSVWEVLITFSIVFLLIVLVTKHVYLALILGILAVATAPAATLLVLREYDSEGVVTNSLLLLTGLNNLICICAFTLFLALSGSEPSTTFLATSVTEPFASLIKVILFILLGFILGFGLSIFEKRFPKANEHMVLTLATIIIATSIAQMAGGSPLLVNLVVGVTVINIAKKGKTLFEEIKRIDLPIYASFFALAGANLHWEHLSNIGIIGIFYIVGRLAGKVLGIAWGASQTRSCLYLKKYGGSGLLSQAGVVLGLTLLIQNQDPQLGQIVSTTILSTVIFFEILGPLALRWTIVKSGEVKIIKLIHRDEGAPLLDSVKEVIARLRFSLGIPVWKKEKFTGDILVKHVMRTHIETIHEDAHFDQLLKAIEHSRYNLFPVVNKEGLFIGMISFQDIREVLYDGFMKDLVIAKDIVNSLGPSISSETNLNEALDMFNRENIDILPVIDNPSAGHLVGILTQRDVLTVFKEKEKK